MFFYVKVTFSSTPFNLGGPMGNRGLKGGDTHGRNSGLKRENFEKTQIPIESLDQKSEGKFKNEKLEPNFVIKK